MNTSEQPISTSLAELLNQQLTALNSIQEIIAKELESVKNRDGDALLAAAADKGPLLEKVTELDLQIGSHPELPSLKTNPELVALQEQITASLEICQTQNEVVYLTAKQTEISIDQVKNIILGGSKNGTYDAYGQKKSGAFLTQGIKA